ncbi:MAG: SGNH/GDSL hydrolase family protein [Wenzhouxiangella sp.]|nr:SGNH/GDSL hydrolase family protein [Wenzhouxiangella sp.]
MIVRNLVFWLGFVLLLPQALWLRRQAPRFADAKGEPVGHVAGPNPLKLLAIGDSIIAGVGCRTLEQALVGRTAKCLAHQLGRGVDWTSLGHTGATSGKILRDLVPLLPDQPADYVLISAGVNDITGLKTLNQWRDRLSALITALQARYPAARIVMLGIPPMGCFPRLPQPLRALFGVRARAFDITASRLLAPLRNVVYVPFDRDLGPEQFAADGYHPSEESCREIAAVLITALASSESANE